MKELHEDEVIAVQKTNFKAPHMKRIVEDLAAAEFMRSFNNLN